MVDGNECFGGKCRRRWGCQGCCISMWVSEGLTGEVTFEQVPELREQAIQVSGRRAFLAGASKQKKALLAIRKRCGRCGESL